MGIRVECDWCREAITPGTPYVTIEVDGKLGAREVGGPARVYCGGKQESCAGRLLALLDANPGGPVDMGMEWQLVSTEGARAAESEREPAGRAKAQTASSTPEPRPVRPDADLRSFFATLAPCARSRFARAMYQEELEQLEQLEEVADAELVALAGVGWKTVTSLRAYLVAWNAAKQSGAPVAIPTLPTLESLGFSDETRMVLRDHEVVSLHDLRLKLRSLDLDRHTLDEIEAVLDEAVPA